MSAPPSPSVTEARFARLVVAAQLVLVGLVVAPRRGARPVGLHRAVGGGSGAAAGLVVMVLGGASLGRGLTAVPLPNRHARLQTGGLYRFVRHPIYSGLLLATGSVAVASGDRRRLAAFAALAALLTGKASWEERHLVRRFPEYAAYAARTPRFVPRRRGGRS